MSDIALFWDIGLIIVTATVLAYVARAFKQPLIVAYFLAGILIGPSGFGLIAEKEIIRTMSELGIAFLLFIVGLELDLKRMRDLGLVSVLTATVKSVLMFGAGFFIAGYFGFTNIEAVYIGLILAFSSTMVVIKLLSDKNELETLHGRLILGILLVEDVLAILALSLLSAGGFSSSILAVSFLKGFGLISLAILLSRFILPTLLAYVSKSQEMLFLTALSICFIFSAISGLAGFSIAIGSFVAGLSVATFPYNVEIIGRMRSLRDFFATIFFVSLGMEIWMPSVQSMLLPILVFLPLIFLLKPFVIMTFASLFGYRRRPAFLTAIGLTQISEFSLIIALQGLALGHIGLDLFSFTAVIAVITMTATGYFIQFDNQIFHMLSRFLIPFDKIPTKKAIHLENLPKRHNNHAIVIGAHRMGYGIVQTLQELEKRYIVVEFDPDIVKALLEEEIPCIYGDIGDIDILNKLNLPDADMVISTAPMEEDNLLLIEETRKSNSDALIFVSSDTLDHALELYDAGADYVILPRMISGEKISDLLNSHKTKKGINSLKLRHIHELEHIKEEELLRKYEPSFLKSLEKKFDGPKK